MRTLERDWFRRDANLAFARCQCSKRDVILRQKKNPQNQTAGTGSNVMNASVGFMKNITPKIPTSVATLMIKYGSERTRNSCRVAASLETRVVSVPVS